MLDWCFGFCCLSFCSETLSFFLCHQGILEEEEGGEEDEWF
jgi:hypothetical protein